MPRTNIKILLQKYWPGIIALATIIFGLIAWQFGDSQIINVVGRIGLLLITAWAANVTLASTQKNDNPQIQRAWRYIGVGLVLWTIAVGIELGFEIFSAITLSLPSPVDLFQLAGSFAFIVAFTSIPSSQYRGFGRIRDLLDIMLLGISAFTLFWLVFFRSILKIGLSDPITVIWSQVHAVSGILLLPIILYRLFQSSKTREFSSFISFALGILAIAISDMAQGYQDLGEPAFGYSWLQAGRILGILFIIISSNFYQGNLIVLQRNAQVQATGKLKWRLDGILPMALIYAVIGFLILDWWATRIIDIFALQATIILAILLIARQAAMVGQSELLRYAELVNATADMAFICDQEGKIVLDNPSLREAIGTSSHVESIPDLDEILITSEPIDSIFNEAMASGWVGEVRFQSMEGGGFPASLSLIPIQDERHRRILFAATAHDLSSVKKRENELRTTLDKLEITQKDLQTLNEQLENKVEVRTQELREMVDHLAELNEELKELDTMKTEFVALVSHELRSPLTNIRTGLEVVLDGAIGIESGTYESLDLILAETDRLGEFVETILDLSALEAGRFPIQLRPLSLQEIIREVYSTFEKQDGGERIRLRIDESTPYVLADDQGVRSVLHHLLDNAIKYTSQGEIIVSTSEEKDKVTTAISDSGPGIPLEEREKVFEMFYRMDSRDSRAVYGRGLGLNLARRFLEVMNGGIEIAQSESQGTEVRFWLPISSDKYE
jgi:PAS domain S-box-containing protein